MPKPKGGTAGNGGKNKRKTKNISKQPTELTLKGEDQEYAQVTKMLGGKNLDVSCFDGKKRIANIRGKMQNSIKINIGDIILVSLRTYQDGVCDVIELYNPHQARKLKTIGELPETLSVAEEKKEDACVFDFEDI